MTFARRSLAYTPVTRAKDETADGVVVAGCCRHKLQALEHKSGPCNADHKTFGQGN